MGQIRDGLTQNPRHSVPFYLFRQMLINGVRVDGATDKSAAQLADLVKSLL